MRGTQVDEAQENTLLFCKVTLRSPGLEPVLVLHGVLRPNNMWGAEPTARRCEKMEGENAGAISPIGQEGS